MFDNYCLRAARYLGFFAREFGLDVSDAIIASIDEDFVDVAKGVRDAAAIKSSYPSKSGRSVPELPPAEFPSTHSATDRIRGIRRQRDFQSVIRDTKSLSGEGGDVTAASSCVPLSARSHLDSQLLSFVERVLMGISSVPRS